MVFTERFASEPLVFYKIRFFKFWDHQDKNKCWNFFSIGRFYKKPFFRFFAENLLSFFFWPSADITRHAPRQHNEIFSMCNSKNSVKNREKHFFKSFPMESKFISHCLDKWSQNSIFRFVGEVSGSGAKPSGKTIKSFWKNFSK